MRYSNLLFSRVVELVFVGPGEALLNTGVNPEPLHPRQQLLGEGFRVFHPTHHVHHHLRVPLPLVVAEVDVEVGHGSEDRHQGLERRKTVRNPNWIY